jgi:hypothetical protein
MSQIKTGEK